MTIVWTVGASTVLAVPATAPTILSIRMKAKKTAVSFVRLVEDVMLYFIPAHCRSRSGILKYMSSEKTKKCGAKNKTGGTCQRTIPSDQKGCQDHQSEGNIRNLGDHDTSSYLREILKAARIESTENELELESQEIIGNEPPPNVQSGKNPSPKPKFQEIYDEYLKNGSSIEDNKPKGPISLEEAERLIGAEPAFQHAFDPVEEYSGVDRATRTVGDMSRKIFPGLRLESVLKPTLDNVSVALESMLGGGTQNKSNASQKTSSGLRHDTFLSVEKTKMARLVTEPMPLLAAIGYDPDGLRYEALQALAAEGVLVIESSHSGPNVRPA